MKTENKWPSLAKMWIESRTLDEKIAKLRARQRALLNGKLGYSSGFGENEERADLTLDVPLVEYLAQFPEEENKCVLHSYETDRQLPDGIREVPCIASYMHWPAKHVCSVPFGKKPLHLWIRASSQTTYAAKPEPITPRQTIAA